MERSSFAHVTDLADITVDALMTVDLISLGPDDTVGRARDLMLGLGIHGLPVVDDEDEVVGIVTSSDLVEEWPFGEPVTTMMSRVLYAVDSEASIVDAADIMMHEHVHHLVVMQDTDLVGIISSFDLLSAVVGRCTPRDGHRPLDRNEFSAGASASANAKRATAISTITST